MARYQSNFKNYSLSVEQTVMEAFGFESSDDFDDMEDVVTSVTDAYASKFPDFIEVYEYNVKNGNMVDEGKYMWGYWERHVVNAQTYLMCIDPDNAYTGKIFVAERMAGGSIRNAFRDDLDGIVSNWRHVRGEIYQSPDFQDFYVFIDYNLNVIIWIGREYFPYVRKWFPNTFKCKA